VSAGCSRYSSYSADRENFHHHGKFYSGLVWEKADNKYITMEKRKAEELLGRVETDCSIRQVRISFSEKVRFK
jgi:hypothetical protein